MQPWMIRKCNRTEIRGWKNDNDKVCKQFVSVYGWVIFSKFTLCLSFCVCIIFLHMVSFQPLFSISFTFLLHIVFAPKKPLCANVYCSLLYNTLYFGLIWMLASRSLLLDPIKVYFGYVMPYNQTLMFLAFFPPIVGLRKLSWNIH